MRRPAPPPLSLQIDELVLRGGSRADGWRIAQALQSELARLIADPAWAQGVRSGEPAPNLTLRLPALAANLRPEAKGQRLAAALSGGLRRQLRGEPATRASKAR